MVRVPCECVDVMCIEVIIALIRREKIGPFRVEEFILIDYDTHTPVVAI